VEASPQDGEAAPLLAPAGALVWWNIFIGNLLAAAGMLLHFFRGHRALSRRLTETWPVED
jgi:hypothetical protein